MLTNYLPIFVATLLGIGMSIGFLFVSRFIGWRKPSEEKSVPFECGNIPFTDAKIQFPVKFYLTALLFVIFDMETIFILVWAVAFNHFKDNGVAAFMLVEMLMFVAILLVGYVFVWKRGGFSWS
jgi:NADH-quinone oxidoreductase subunit A